MGLLLPAILALLLGIFAVANRHMVSVALWPGGWLAELPLWQIILIPCALSFLAGALVVWLAHLPQKWNIRRLRKTAAKLDAELAAREPEPAKLR
ncbi:lipopolysaccharide assembly protein LapA domain-containing protein [Roseococcus sp. YIM B11640]|uniref:lipopolysaccharide assembly protein LapA domain-containing protein n=1 Tax=Roseococcus sp. YIM B11640 TaxID=3133973 RepID=UPI003C7D7F5B